MTSSMQQLLLLALSCAPARGLQTAGSAASAVHVEGLTPDNWVDAFDPTSPVQPNIQVPPRAMTAQSLQEHMSVVQASARAIGRQMGVPYMPHDFSASLGDGSVAGVRAKTQQHFSMMERHVPGISGVSDLLVQQIGNPDRPVDPEQAFESYSMIAQRLGAKTLASQLAPLLRATTPPNPSVMFNTIGNILSTHGMPEESIRFYRDLARMYSGWGTPSQRNIQGLQNRTLLLLRNRTLQRPMTPGVPKLAREGGVPDYYKSTSNMGVVSFQLPCPPGTTVCFALTTEFYSFKSGPGIYDGAYNPGVPGGLSLALGVSTQTPWSLISTPFYVYPSTAVGHEYDLKFTPEPYTLPDSPKTSISGLVKLRESSDCLGTGVGTPDSPRVDTCPMACLVLAGGQPSLHSILEILPVRAVGRDALASFYDILSYGGNILHKIESQFMPKWAWVAFYRQVGSSSRVKGPVTGPIPSSGHVMKPVGFAGQAR